MEGVVAGVPSLADYDVIIDAGSDASDPENAVPFDVETPAGRTFKQPGNLNYLIETSVFGTEPKFRAKGVQPDLDGDGTVEFGEALPDADFYVAAARTFEKYAKELDAAAREWEPTPGDALTALVVMTPTMSEYFEAWKNSRFIAGSKATEKAFVVASRLQDIADILGGLVLVYDNVQPLVTKADAQQAQQTEQSLTKLHAFAAQLRDKEAGGRRYTAEEADTLGSQAQERAEAVAGQITQAAAKLNIEIEEG
jgi:Imelysin